MRAEYFVDLRCVSDLCRKCGSVDGARQCADAGAGAKAVAAAQQGNGLVKWLTIIVLNAGGQSLSRYLLQPVHSVRSIVNVCCSVTQGTEQGAGFDGCQLILVTEYHQTGLSW